MIHPIQRISLLYRQGLISRYICTMFWQNDLHLTFLGTPEAPSLSRMNHLLDYPVIGDW